MYTHGKLTREGEWLAAVAAMGDGAALTALNAAGLLRRNPLRARGHHGRRPEAATAAGVQADRRPRSARHPIRNGIPVTTFERMLIDLPLKPEQCANLIHEGAYRRVFSAAATRAPDRADARSSRQARASDRDARSRKCRHAVVPRGRVLGARARRAVARADHRHPRASGIEVDFRWGDCCVEVDGPGHQLPAVRAADEAKQAQLEAHGFTVVRFTEAAIEREPREVLRELAAQELARRVARKCVDDLDRFGTLKRASRAPRVAQLGGVDVARRRRRR